MPHTVRDVGTLALRKLGVLRSGGEPSAADAEAARQSLESLYSEWITQGTFGRVYNVAITKSGSVTPGHSMHVNVTTDEEVSIDLPATMQRDFWSTWRGDLGLNVPRDKSVVIVTDQFGAGRATYVYDGTVQRWMRTDTIKLSDEAPLSARGIDGLASVLAIRLTEQFGSELASPQTLRSANSYRTALVCNFGNEDDEGYTIASARTNVPVPAEPVPFDFADFYNDLPEN